MRMEMNPRPNTLNSNWKYVLSINYSKNYELVPILGEPVKVIRLFDGYAYNNLLINKILFETNYL